MFSFLWHLDRFFFYLKREEFQQIIEIKKQDFYLK